MHQDGPRWTDVGLQRQNDRSVPSDQALIKAGELRIRWKGVDVSCREWSVLQGNAARTHEAIQGCSVTLYRQELPQAVQSRHTVWFPSMEGNAIRSRIRGRKEINVAER